MHFSHMTFGPPVQWKLPYPDQLVPRLVQTRENPETGSTKKGKENPKEMENTLVFIICTCIYKTLYITKKIH